MTIPATFNIPNLKRWAASKEAQAAFRAYLAAKAHAENTRARVDEYIGEVFKRFTFYPAADMGFCVEGKEVGPDGRILSPDHLHLTDLESANYKAFSDACDEAHKAHGYDVQPGICPALVAESAIVRMESALICSLSKALGFDFTRAYGSMRERLLKTAMACLANKAA